MFSCDRCGECCRHVNLSQLYCGLDRGDGICRYLQGNLCSIYETRPLLCRVDESYELFFKDKMKREDYYNRNKRMCEKLKKYNR